MLFALERITQPQIEPISIAEAKQHLRITDPAGSPYIAHPDDDQIEGLITGAREWAEEYTGRALVEQSWRLTIYRNDGVVFPVDTVPNITGIYYWGQHGEIMLHKSPVVAISSFVTVDTAGVETTVGVGSPLEANYALREGNSKYPRIVGLSGTPWSGGDALKIEFRAGYAPLEGSPLESDLSKVPQRFKTAIKLHVEAHYDRDEKMMPILLQAAKNLLEPERIHLGFA